jgi:protoporphyrinogen oxidase
LISEIENSLPSNIKLSGNAYHGIGMPDTVHSAKRAVDEIEIDIKKNEKL